MDGTTPGSMLILGRPSGVDAYFLFSTVGPCSEQLFGRLGQLLSFFSQWRPYVLSCFLGRLRGPQHSSYQPYSKFLSKRLSYSSNVPDLCRQDRSGGR